MDDAFDGTDGTEIATDECPWDETTSAFREPPLCSNRPRKKWKWFSQLKFISRRVPHALLLKGVLAVAR